VQIDWWPVTRDCVIYISAISLLVVIAWDGVVYWYEALVLFIAYFVYFTVMFNNKRIAKFIKEPIERRLAKKNSSTGKRIKNIPNVVVA
jgi:Ca2+/Na+ antiporter